MDGRHNSPAGAALGGHGPRESRAVQDAEFRTWWAEHRVTSSSHGTKLYRHRLVGDLTLDRDMWRNPDGSGQRLMVLTGEPGSLSHDASRILTSWTAGQASANLVEGRNP